MKGFANYIIAENEQLEHELTIDFECLHKELTPYEYLVAEEYGINPMAHSTARFKELYDELDLVLEDEWQAQIFIKEMEEQGYIALCPANKDYHRLWRGQADRYTPSVVFVKGPLMLLSDGSPRYFAYEEDNTLIENRDEDISVYSLSTQRALLQSVSLDGLCIVTAKLSDWFALSVSAEGKALRRKLQEACALVVLFSDQSAREEIYRSDTELALKICDNHRLTPKQIRVIGEGIRQR